MEKWKESEKGQKAEYLGKKTIKIFPLYVPLFSEDDWPRQLMMDIKDDVVSILKDKQGKGDYILYIEGFSEADEETDILIQNKVTNKLYSSRVNFILSGKERKVSIQDDQLFPVENIDCGGINFFDAFVKTSICKISIRI